MRLMATTVTKWQNNSQLEQGTSFMKKRHLSERIWWSSRALNTGMLECELWTECKFVKNKKVGWSTLMLTFKNSTLKKLCFKCYLFERQSGREYDPADVHTGGQHRGIFCRQWWARRSFALCTSDIPSLSQIIKQNRQAWAFLFKKINFCKI